MGPFPSAILKYWIHTFDRWTDGGQKGLQRTYGTTREPIKTERWTKGLDDPSGSGKLARLLTVQRPTCPTIKVRFPKGNMPRRFYSFSLFSVRSKIHLWKSVCFTMEMYIDNNILILSLNKQKNEDNFILFSSTKPTNGIYKQISTKY